MAGCRNVIILGFIVPLLLSVSCGKGPNESGGGTVVPAHEGSGTSLVLTPFMELNQGDAELNSHAGELGCSRLALMYPYSTEFHAQYPYYPRCRRMSNGNYILFWQQSGSADMPNGKDTYYAISSDFKNWTPYGTFCASKTITNAKGKSDTRRYTNANAIVLSNGDLLGAASFWCSSTYDDKSCISDQGIVIKRSTDNGKNWSEETEIYHGPCWEPHLMELHNGEIHIYFSESRPWISASHSGTDVLVSKDGGVTWSPKIGAEPNRVMRHQYWSDYNQQYLFTDQMPVGIVLNGSSKMAFAMECVTKRVASGSGVGQSFQVCIDYSPEDGKWQSLSGNDCGPEEQLMVVDKATAPYLVQFPSGETVLTYTNSAYNDYFAYRIGNEKAADFGDANYVFSKTCRWGGMEVDSDHTLIFYAQNRENGTENATIALARYALNHNISATARTVTVDGKNNEWGKTDEALFVGSVSETQSTLRVSQDSENVYFLFESADVNLRGDDYACLFLSTASEDILSSKSVRIKFNCNGVKNIGTYAGGWHESDSIDPTVSISYDGTVGNPSDVDNGYLAEIAIPRSSLDIIDGELRVNFSVFDSTASADDSISNTAATTSAGWITIKRLNS